jgi:hypothetical protein
LSNYSVQAGQLRKWKSSAFNDLNGKIFLVLSTHGKSGVEWADILLDGKTVRITAFTIRIDTDVVE